MAHEQNSEDLLIAVRIRLDELRPIVSEVVGI